jgi:hypothetical protein
MFDEQFRNRFDLTKLHKPSERRTNVRGGIAHSLSSGFLLRLRR